MGEIIKEYLKYVFSREEKEEMSAGLAQKLSDLEQKRLEKKEVVKSIDSDIAGMESVVSKLARNVKDGYEFRNVECSVEYDYEAKTKSIIRNDTDEVVRTVPMSQDEMQRKLPLGVVQ